MVQRHDPLAPLKRPPPTPRGEICRCRRLAPIVLVSRLCPNPIMCSRCRGEVPPERLRLTARQAEDISGWLWFHDCFYRLWLDSNEFETWAARQLEDPKSPVNQRGLALRKQLDRKRRCFYAWFADESSEGFRPRTTCPVCRRLLRPLDRYRVCLKCRILLFA